jgi:DNA-binding response OmpR family regulator
MSRSPSRTKILIAEDDPIISELLTIRLELAGYHTAVVRDGEEVLDRVSSINPEGLILDIGLPRMDGFEILSLLKGAGGLATLPTLVLTARHAASDVQRAIKLGAWDYLAKPFDDRKLIERVARMLQRKDQLATACPI